MKLVAARCPSCNANIEVDKNSDSTKCDFCDTKIIVEDAIAKYKIELSGEVSVKNMPKLDNYLKLGERHYKDGEYEEAYDKYSKAVELDPDNWLAILRKGICKSLCTNYLDFEIKPTVNGIKNAYDLLKEEKKTKEIDQVVKEANQTFSQLVSLVVNYYRTNDLYLGGINDVNGKLLACINSYVYLNSIVENKETKTVVLTSLIYAIDRLLEPKRYNTGRYNKYANPILAYSNLNSIQKKHWVSMKTQYTYEKNMLDPVFAKNQQEIEKKNEEIKQNRLKRKAELEEKAKSNLKVLFRPIDILCYLGALFYLFLFIGAIFINCYLASIIFLIGAVIFIPFVGHFIVSKNGLLKSSVYIARGCILFAGVVVGVAEMTESQPRVYEGVWISEQGTKLTINSEKIVIENVDGQKVITTYDENHVDLSYDESIDYYYTLTTDNIDENKNYLRFKYTHYLDDKTELCLLEKRECVEYFTFQETTEENESLEDEEVQHNEEVIEEGQK